MKPYLKKIFLDDYREPKDVTWGITSSYQQNGWYIVKTAEDFVELIEKLNAKTMPYVISFDHDLIAEHYQLDRDWGSETIYETEEFKDVKRWTGYNCAEYLMEYCMKNDYEPPIMYCHSLNWDGARNINKMWSRLLPKPNHRQAK